MAVAPPPLSLLRRVLASAAVVVTCVLGGSLECHHAELSAAEADGRQLYTRMCTVCHGSRGEGYRADEAPAIGHAEFLGSANDVFLRSAIQNGRPNTTMSAWSTARGGPLSPADADAVVAFLRTWRRGPKIPLDETPLHGDVARGQALYDRECLECHGAKGVGGPKIHIGSRELLSTSSNGFLRHAIRNGRKGTTMPGFEAKLGKQGVEDVIALLRSYQALQNPHTPEPPRSRPPPLPLGPVPLNPKGPEPKGFKAYPDKTPGDVIKAELDRHAKLAFLDARAPSDYTNEHIAGAVSVPFYDPAPYVDKLPRDAWLIAYCSCPAAESGMLAAALQKEGFKKVTILAEGIGYWRGKGYGTNKGTEP